jgi:D-ribose pyranase
METELRILNGQLAKAIVSLAHGEMLVIADAGLPIPHGTESIDLALVPGVPSFIDVLMAVVGSCAIEAAVLANETSLINPELFRQIGAQLPSNITAQQVAHDVFKQRIKQARFVVRTGECTPYANIALIGAAPFFMPKMA